MLTYIQILKDIAVNTIFLHIKCVQKHIKIAI